MVAVDAVVVIADDGVVVIAGKVVVAGVDVVVIRGRNDAGVVVAVVAVVVVVVHVVVAVVAVVAVASEVGVAVVEKVVHRPIVCQCRVVVHQHSLHCCVQSRRQLHCPRHSVLQCQRQCPEHAECCIHYQHQCHCSHFAAHQC